MRLSKIMLAAGLSSLFAAVPAQAQVEVQWWHSMGGALGEWVNDLAKEFNASQSDYLDMVRSYAAHHKLKIADDKLERLDYIDSGHLVKVTACVPTAIKQKVKQQIIDESKFMTKEGDGKVINARLDALENKGEVTPEGVGYNFFVETLRPLTGDVEKLKVNNLQLSGGLTGALGTRNGVMGDVGLVGEVTGWFARRFGLGIQASVGLAFEPADSDQVSPWLFVQGSLLATFGLDLDRHFVLEVGPSFRQTIRPSAEGDGVTGNFFGGSYGGRVDLSIQPGTAPLAIVPFLELGGGPVAGWSDGRKFEGPMFQAFVGLDLKLVGGFLIGDSTK